ncbi:hypothetical protein Tco_0865919 [Tanacetum coccineum]
MKTLYTSIKSASPSFKVDERTIWGEISGLPLYTWGSNAFKKVECMFGKFMFFGAEESIAMSSGRVCVSTRSHKFMSEKVHVEVHGETFEVQVHELGTWSISITNTSLDTSSHIDMNDIKKVVATVEENSVDDLNDLNDNLYELSCGIKEDEVHMDNPNDTVMDKPQAFMKEKVCNAPNSSKVGEPSDPSYPPGFEHMKRSFSNTTVLEALPDIRITALDRLCFDDVIKSVWSSLEETNDGRILRSHEKLQIDDGIATPLDRDIRIQLLQEIDKLDNFEALDLIQKAHIKWNIEVDGNSNFFNWLIKQKCRSQAINGIMHDGAHDSQVIFPLIVHSTSLSSLDCEYLETHVSLEEIKSAIWECGSNKAPGPDGFSFSFIKKY